MVDPIKQEQGTAAQRMLPLLEHLSRVGRRSAEVCMDEGCLRPRQLIALTVLGEHGPMTQHVLGVTLSLDPSNVVGLLNELEERGLIARRRDPADRRRHIVELSAAGSEQVTQSNEQLGHVEDDLFKTLSAEERSTLYRLLARVVSAQAPGQAQSPCVAVAQSCTAETDECTAEPADR